MEVIDNYSIITIFKGGDRSLVTNFKPISKQNVMPKMFENIVADKLALLCKSTIINEQQDDPPLQI